MSDEKPGQWSHYQKLVLTELKDLKKMNAKLFEKMGDMDVDIATLQVKSGIWGAAAGTVPVLILIGIQYLTGK